MNLSIVVPVYNEENAIIPFYQELVSHIPQSTEIIFALDPSLDQTDSKILELRARDSRVKLIKLSRRFGQPAATLAGLEKSSGDLVIVMDVDLQDPPSLIPQMIARRLEGFDVVIAKRRSRQGEPMIKRAIAKAGYFAMAKLSDVPIPRDAGDFRLMTKKVVQHLLSLKESHGYLRGLVAIVGFKQSQILFDRPERRTGSSQYNRYLGSIKIGLNGIISFSSILLRSTTIIGMILLVCGLALAILKPTITNETLLISLVLLTGILLLSMGLQGAFIGRIYDEVKGRPKYIIDEEWGF